MALDASRLNMGLQHFPGESSHRTMVFRLWLGLLPRNGRRRGTQAGEAPPLHSMVILWSLIHSTNTHWKPPYSFFSFLFWLFILYWSIANEQRCGSFRWRDSAMYIHVSILPWILPPRLPHNMERSSLCYSVGPCWLSALNIAVCMLMPTS